VNAIVFDHVSWRSRGMERYSSCGEVTKPKNLTYQVGAIEDKALRHSWDNQNTQTYTVESPTEMKAPIAYGTLISQSISPCHTTHCTETTHHTLSKNNVRAVITTVRFSTTCARQKAFTAPRYPR
jgi:hypothetical protein